MRAEPGRSQDRLSRARQAPPPDHGRGESPRPAPPPATAPTPSAPSPPNNGTEFHGYATLEHQRGGRFYFATPHHAWERGTNENTNGLLWQYLPKGQTMQHLTQHDALRGDRATDARSVTGSRFRALALGLPQATERTHMQHPDFRVRNRIFATLTADETGAAVKCVPVNLDQLARMNPETFRNAWGGRWLGIRLACAREAHVRELLEDAWRLVAPKQLVATFDAESPERPKPRSG